MSNKHSSPALDGHGLYPHVSVGLLHRHGSDRMADTVQVNPDLERSLKYREAMQYALDILSAAKADYWQWSTHETMRILREALET